MQRSERMKHRHVCWHPSARHRIVNGSQALDDQLGHRDVHDKRRIVGGYRAGGQSRVPALTHEISAPCRRQAPDGPRKIGWAFCCSDLT